jgi:hypothetical protein
VAFHLMDLNRNFSCEICKTHCLMSQSLDNMHASLPVLKYRSPFLLVLLVVWLMKTCYLWFGHLHRLASSPLELAHVSLFPDLFTQLNLCGAQCDLLPG